VSGLTGVSYRHIRLYTYDTRTHASDVLLSTLPYQSRAWFAHVYAKLVIGRCGQTQMINVFSQKPCRTIQIRMISNCCSRPKSASLQLTLTLCSYTVQIDNPIVVANEKASRDKLSMTSHGMYIDGPLRSGCHFTSLRSPLDWLGPHVGIFPARFVSKLVCLMHKAVSPNSVHSSRMRNWLRVYRILGEPQRRRRPRHERRIGLLMCCFAMRHHSLDTISSSARSTPVGVQAIQSMTPLLAPDSKHMKMHVKTVHKAYGCSLQIVRRLYLRNRRPSLLHCIFSYVLT
jgi:hypothetical protein